MKFFGKNVFYYDPKIHKEPGLHRYSRKLVASPKGFPVLSLLPMHRVES